MKYVKITIEDEDSKVLITMKPNANDKMTTEINFEPEVNYDNITTAQIVGLEFFRYIAERG